MEAKRRLAFDIEADNLLLDVTKAHCIWVGDVDTLEYWGFKPGEIQQALELLSTATTLIGHNIINYDLQALQKVYGWTPGPGVELMDTLILGCMRYPDIKKKDMIQAQLKAKRKPYAYDLPPKLWGKQTLQAWGYRLGVNKIEFDSETGFEVWTEQMHEYCRRDVEVTVALFQKLERKMADFSRRSIHLEHEFAKLIARQYQRGVHFDLAGAEALKAPLEEKLESLLERLQALVPPTVQEIEIVPKANNSRYGYIKGVPTIKRVETPFNPGSRQQVAKFLIEKYDWHPVEFSNDEVDAKYQAEKISWDQAMKLSEPKVSEKVLEALDYPEAGLIADYLRSKKLLSQLSTGKESWLNHYRFDTEAIHGGVMTVGTPTARARHFSPNLAQVPGTDKLFGHECRALYKARPGFVMLGTDGMALEFRCLAHYLHRYDAGRMSKKILNPDVLPDGTVLEVHTANRIAVAKAVGQDLPVFLDAEKGRKKVKNCVYCTMYGGQNERLARTGGFVGKSEDAKPLGERMRVALENEMTGYDLLTKTLNTLIRKQKREGVKDTFLMSIDGRPLYVRHKHALLNTLLQSAGSIAVKLATILFDRYMQELGYKPLVEYCMVLHIHDEFQVEVRENFRVIRDAVRCAKRAFRDAGKKLRFNLPLEGDCKLGRSWDATH